MSEGVCELCLRKGVALTRHHLIPRTRLKGKRNPGRLAKQDALERVAMLCRACHSFAHRTLTEQEMADQYRTVAALRSHPEIQKFVEWIRDRPPGFQPKTR
jgi:5-methylcytosine-specific restriction endonuclease McrA